MGRLGSGGWSPKARRSESRGFSRNAASLATRGRASGRDHAGRPARAPVAADPAPRARAAAGVASTTSPRTRVRPPHRLPRPRRADAGRLPVVTEKRDGRIFYRFLDSSGSATCRSRPTRSSRSPSARTSCARSRARSSTTRSARRSPRSAPGSARARRVPRAARRVVPRAAGAAQELRAPARDDPDAERGGARAPQRAHPLPHRPHRRGLDARARPVPRLVPQRRALRGGPRPQVARGAHVRGRPHHAARADRERFAVPPTSTSTRYIGASFGVIAEPRRCACASASIRAGPATSQERTWHASQELERRAAAASSSHGGRRHRRAAHLDPLVRRGRRSARAGGAARRGDARSSAGALERYEKRKR